MTLSIRALLLSGLLALPAPGVLAQLADVALVNRVSGEVSFTPVNGVAARVQPYMLVREGDRFLLSPGSQLGIVFFEGARRERWDGPASLRAARAQGEAINGTVAEVTRLPVAAAPRIARIPELMQNAKLGGIQVRGVPRNEPRNKASAEEALRDAREAYAQMRRELAADDPTPELFLAAALSEHQRFDELVALTERLQREHPGNGDFRLLADWARRRAGR